MDDKTHAPNPDNFRWDNDGTADVLPGTATRPTAGEPLASVIDRAISRRALLKGSAVAGATLVIAPSALLAPSPAAAAPRHRDPGSRLTFETVPPGNEPDIVVPPGYSVDILLRWGDPLTPAAPEFDVDQQSPAAQAQQFGFNADLVLWYPLPRLVARSVGIRGRLGAIANRSLGLLYPRLATQTSRHALVVVNHEYTSGVDMFPGYDSAAPTAEQVRIEIEAHGFSIVELRLGDDGRWRFERGSPFNRRSTGSTPIEIAGPLRGHALMRTSADPDGVEVLGSLNNCAGGKTPWGTILTCEENFDQYFANFTAVTGASRAVSERIPAPDGASERRWEDVVERFDLAKEPNEYNRFGYVVEVDPYDPGTPAKKRTALGRFKHEGAAARIARDGRVAIYSGDDARFEYVYKFVSAGTYDRFDRAANLDLLDRGTLYVARFDVGDVAGDDMGDGVWLELSPENPILADWTLEQILLDTRGAADAVGATPMDRPEDVEVSPQTGKVYIALTNNSRRTEPDEANPRIANEHGHIIELIEDDPADLAFRWNILVKCGDPAVAEHETRFGDVTDPIAAGISPIADPDNLVHDDDGNLWIATDGQYFSGSVGFGQNDGIFAVPVEGTDRGRLRQFLSGVPGGEVCGPEFSGDNKTFFCAIQHPHDGEAFAKLWPTDETRVSRPSLVAVRRNDGRKIGR
ncbi:PhoX family protein [Thiococcus pfennigii]|uniref:PhoX family protein n=1 Tax=Thiococcus pfennigii TaxID=1057 RepID=UPI00190741E7|nr:PhoX family phosphatase [Thiococcus pfennigii]MBK1700391.1 hypothetical protein [Thiococcus pfennigii]